MRRKIVSAGDEPVQIGKIIEDELRRQERTVTWLSRKINCDRRNIYNIFSRGCIDTDLLYRLSVALNTDFFKYFSASLQSSENKDFTTPPPHRPSDCAGGGQDAVGLNLRSGLNAAALIAANRRAKGTSKAVRAQEGEK